MCCWCLVVRGVVGILVLFLVFLLLSDCVGGGVVCVVVRFLCVGVCSVG